MMINLRRTVVRTLRWARALRALSRPYGSGTSSRAGFTLVEIIVALAILALSLSSILPAISDALWRTSEAEAQAEAASLARSLLAQAGTAVPLNDGAAAGQFVNGFRWRLEVMPYAGAEQAGPVRAYRVVAEVSWDDARHGRSLALTALRLVANGAGR
jgi:general secretion pathway protein I